MLTWIVILVVILGLIVILIGKPVKILKGDEMAVVEFLGKPVRVIDSGINLLWPFFEKVIVYPKRRFVFTYEVDCFTKEGLTEETEKEEYKGIPLRVTVVSYINFPREPRRLEEIPKEKRKELKEKGEKTEITHPLIIIRRNAIPKDEEGLKEYIGGIIESIVRNTIGTISYNTLLTKKEEVEKVLKQHLVDPEGELIKSGFSAKGLSIVITAIKLPQELEKALPIWEIEKKETAGAPYEAKQRMIETVGALASSFYPRLSIEDALEKFTQENKEKALEIGEKMIEREMAIKRQVFQHLHISTEGGNELASLTGMIAGMARIVSGKGKEEERKEKEEKREREPRREMSPAEMGKIQEDANAYVERWLKRNK